MHEGRIMPSTQQFAPARSVLRTSAFKMGDDPRTDHDRSSSQVSSYARMSDEGSPAFLPTDECFSDLRDVSDRWFPSVGCLAWRSVAWAGPRVCCFCSPPCLAFLVLFSGLVLLCSSGEVRGYETTAFLSRDFWSTEYRCDWAGLRQPLGCRIRVFVHMRSYLTL